MESIRDAIKYLDTAIQSLPKNTEVAEMIEQGAGLKFSDVVKLWNDFATFITPITAEYIRRGDRLEYTVLHNFHVFFKMYGNRFQTSVDALNREYVLSGDLPEFAEYKDEALKILKLITETNKTYVIGKVALRNLVVYLQTHQRNIPEYLAQSIETKIFVQAPSEQSKFLLNYRRECRADAAPHYMVLGAATSMSKFSTRGSQIMPFSAIAIPLGILDDISDLFEIDLERGRITIQVDDDWGIYVGGSLDPSPYIEVGIYGDFDWDEAIAGALNMIADAISDAFDCGY